MYRQEPNYEKIVEQMDLYLKEQLETSKKRVQEYKDANIGTSFVEGLLFAHEVDLKFFEEARRIYA